MITINVVMKMKKEVLVVVMLMNLINYGSSQTVTIGNQVWMTKNLDVSKFRNGDNIFECNTFQEWDSCLINGIPCYTFLDFDSDNDKTYGKLYNIHSILDPRGLIPDGYRIPSENDYDDLINHIKSLIEIEIDSILKTDPWYKNFAGEIACNHLNSFTERLKSTSGWTNYYQKKVVICPNCRNWNDSYSSKVACHVCKDSRKIIQEYIVSGNGTNTLNFSSLPSGLLVKFNGKYEFIHHNANYAYTKSVDKDSLGVFCITFSKDRFPDCDINNRGVIEENRLTFKTELGYSNGWGVSIRCLKKIDN